MDKIQIEKNFFVPMPVILVGTQVSGKGQLHGPWADAHGPKPARPATSPHSCPRPPPTPARRASCFMKSFPLDELRVGYLRDSHDITFFRCSNEDLIKRMSIPPQIIQEEMQNNWGIELQDLASILVFMILALSIAACPPAHHHKWSGKC